MEKTTTSQQEELQIIDRCRKENQHIFRLFYTRPYSLSAITNFKNINYGIVSNNDIAQIVSAETGAIRQ
jgi:hypothetical protein